MKRVGVIATAVVVLTAAVAVAVWVWSNSAATPGGSSAPDTSASAPDAGPSRPPDAFALTVRYVYDGDTIRAQMQAPNDVVTTAKPIRIRVIGVDTPEGTPTAECWADEARTHLRDLLPEGSTVWAAADRDTWDDYGRRLFNLWTDDGRFIPAELVRAGDAEAIRIWPNVAHFELLAALQRQAQDAARGRWGVCG